MNAAEKRGPLPTAIGEGLAGVARRRLWLLAVRGGAVATAVAAVACLAVAVADRAVLLSEAGRWSLAVLLCGVSAVGALLAALPFWRRWNALASARLVEAAVPSLKHRLLAAVELAGDAEQASRGSAAFREVLQQSVAEAMAGVRAEAVLPWQRIHRVVWGAMAAVALSAGLFAVPSLALPEHLLRILLPAANIARPSLAELRFLTPASPEAVVPLGERLAVQLEMMLPEGGAWALPKTVRLEVEPLVEQPRRVAIDLTAQPTDDAEDPGSRYQGQWLVDAQRLRYRAVSSLGETPWRVLEAVARPTVEGVEVTVTPPDYAAVAATTFSGDSADAAAVIGSLVRWTLTPSRPLQSATLVWRDAAIGDDEADSMPLVADEDGRWSLQVPVETTRRLQFELVGVEGMPSEFPATSRLTALEDEPPQLIWRQPEMYEATVPAVSSHRLEVELSDEFPLTSVEQWIRINRGPWVTQPCGFNPEAADQLVSWQWDLLGLALVPGDLVESMLVAVDRRGLQGESPTLAWVVSESLLELAATPARPARREIAGRLAALAAELETVLGAPAEAVSPQSMAATLRDAADLAASRSAEIREAIHQTLAEPNSRLAADELTVTAAALSRLEGEEAEALRSAAEMLSDVAAGPAEDAAALQEAAVRQAERFREQIEKVDRRFRSLVGQDVLDEAARRLDAAVRFQAELVSRPEMIGSEAHSREQQLLSVHMRALATSLGRDAALLPGGAARQAVVRKQWAEEIADRLERVRPSAEDEEGEPPQPAITEAADVLSQLEANRSVHGISPGLSGETRQARRELRQLAGTAAEVIERTAAVAHSTTAASADRQRLAKDALGQLMDRRTALLVQADSQQAAAAADLGSAYRGLAGRIADEAAFSDAAQASFATASHAVQTLEAAGRLDTAMAWIDQLLSSERTAGDRVTAHTATPRLWEATSQELDDAATAIHQAGLPRDVADAVRAARWSPAAEEIGRKVSPRQWDLSRTVSAVAELETLRGTLQGHADALEPAVVEARATLRGLAPSITDLAREAAERANQQRQTVEQLADEAAAGETTDLEAVLPPPDAAIHEIASQLQSALVDEAASQDLLDAAERSRAQDADHARELVQASQEQVDHAAAKAREAAGDQQAALAELSAAFEGAAETFEMIAEHFAREPQAAGGAAEQERSQALADAAARQAPQAAARLDAAYDKAEELGSIAETPPDEMLRRLEEELRTNLPMRDALSDIASGLAEQSQQALAFAAERERILRHDVEASDATIREEKRQFVAELRVVAEQTARVAQRLGQEAQRQAAAAGVAQRQEQLATLATQLEQAAAAVRSVPETAGVAELVAAAGRLDQAIETAGPGLREAAEALATAARQALEQTDDQQRRALSEATVASGRWHQQDVRWADQDLRTRERRIQDADRLVQEAARQLERAHAQIDKSRQQLAAEAASGARHEQLQRAEVQLQEAEAIVGLASAIRQREERRLEEARSQREQVGRQPAVLAAENPQAEFAARLTKQAASRAAELSAELGGMLADAGWQEQLQGSQGQLTTAARQQETVTASVADAARSLERAAAHELRLGGFATAGQLADAAQRVEATARQEPVAAGAALEAAAASEEARSVAARATTASSQAAVEALSRSGEAIAQRADALARLLAPTADSEDGSDSREGSSSGEAGQSPSATPGSQAMAPADMARMLDQLDREQRQSQPGSPSSPGQSGEPSAARRAMRRPSSQLARGLQRQRGTPGQPQPQQSQQASMTDAEGTPSMATQSGSGQLAKATTGDAAGDVRLLQADGREVLIGGWNQLRQQQAGEVVESLREAVSPRYRRQVEHYFRGLSERGGEAGGAR